MKKRGIVTKRVNEFPTPYTCRNAIQKGGPETKLSMILMGLGNFVHGQKIKGLLYLAVEVAYIVFMAVNGITFLSMLGGLGSVPQKEVWDEASQVYLYTKGDQSILILLYGVATILVSVLMVFAGEVRFRVHIRQNVLQKKENMSIHSGKI